MQNQIEVRGSFTCVGSDGNAYTVERVVDIHNDVLRGRVHKRDGETAYRCNGHLVGRVAKGRYRTWTGIELKARDPSAP